MTSYSGYPPLIVNDFAERPGVTIWVIHGVVARADPQYFGHRNLLDAERFRSFLEMRSPRFVDLDEAIAERGPALTIDDGTTAAADAAELCRAAGHAVTVFVNARNIARQQTYWFALLNALVDSNTSDCIFLDGEWFALHTLAARQRFRKAAKLAALTLRDEEAREAFILSLARGADLDSLAVAAPLATISLERLRRLQALGVRIENHGWTHGDVAAMTLPELGEDLRQGADWLREVAAVVTSHYAVPFGSALPPPALPVEQYGWWHLADERLPAGQLDARLVNRVMLAGDAL